MDLNEIIIERERKLNWYIYKNVDYDTLTEEQRKEIIRKELENENKRKEQLNIEYINRIIFGTVLAPIWIPAWLGICSIAGICNLF
jgi:hypothetical protein